ncbi:flagellar biosynthesis anti-sigma factor FlgM [Propionivibrio sp.]|uniref:flagellar biosynthesis anti-sigma factor FlgM n=1 Tax=Propionivibrio sp. TaxID=2212460 RepID=UPI003BF3914B
MKIESSTNPVAAPPVKETRVHSASNAASAVVDDVKLSGLSAQMRAADGEQPFDAARVSEIKQAITDGRFTINAGAIADRLLTSARELVDSQRRA